MHAITLNLMRVLPAPQYFGLMDTLNCQIYRSRACALGGGCRSGERRIGSGPQRGGTVAGLDCAGYSAANTERYRSRTVNPLRLPKFQDLVPNDGILW